MKVSKNYSIEITMKGVCRRILMVSLAGVVLLLGTTATTYAKWEIEYSDWLVNVMRRQGHSIEKRVGNFATRNECQQALERAVLQSGDPYLRNNMTCVGSDDSAPASSPDSLSTHPRFRGNRASEAEQERAVQERQRQEQEKAEKEKTEAFEREKEKLLRSFKGGTSTGLTTGTTGLALKGSGSSQAIGLKTYDPAIRERTMKAIKELNCSAYWALNAAGVALKGDYETARQYGEFSATAKGGNTVSGCPEVKVYVPDVPPPVEANPQIQLYNHIIQQAEILVPGIIETQQKIKDTKKSIEKTGEDIVVKKEKIKQLDKNINHPRRLDPRVMQVKKEEAEKELDELTKQALELQKVADQLDKNADGQKEKLADLQGIYESVKQNPQCAEELIKKMR